MRVSSSVLKWGNRVRVRLNMTAKDKTESCEALWSQSIQNLKCYQAGNCHVNAVAGSFFATIKQWIIKRNIYSTRNDTKAEIFNLI